MEIQREILLVSCASADESVMNCLTVYVIPGCTYQEGESIFWGAQALDLVCVGSSSSFPRSRHPFTCLSETLYDYHITLFISHSVFDHGPFLEKGPANCGPGARLMTGRLVTTSHVLQHGKPSWGSNKSASAEQRPQLTVWQPSGSTSVLCVGLTDPDNDIVQTITIWLAFLHDGVCLFVASASFPEVQLVPSLFLTGAANEVPAKINYPADAEKHHLTKKHGNFGGVFVPQAQLAVLVDFATGRLNRA